MTIAICADVHLGNFKRFGGPAVASLNERCRLALASFQAAVHAANKRKADTFIVAGKVDETAGAVATLIKMLDGTTAWSIGQAANAAFQAVTGIIDIVLSFRKHRRSLGRTSFEVVPAANA